MPMAITPGQTHRVASEYYIRSNAAAQATMASDFTAIGSTNDPGSELIKMGPEGLADTGVMLLVNEPHPPTQAVDVEASQPPRRRRRQKTRLRCASPRSGSVVRGVQSHVSAMCVHPLRASCTKNLHVIPLEERDGHESIRSLMSHVDSTFVGVVHRHRQRGRLVDLFRERRLRVGQCLRRPQTPRCLPQPETPCLTR